MKIKLGTRGSDLALAQSRWVAGELQKRGAIVELEVISTSGDRSAAPSFGSIGPQGVFVREIEEALVDNRIDVAVHSFKDLPTASPAELIVAAVPARRDPADFLLMRKDAYAEAEHDLLPLDSGRIVGTSSARRQAWFRHERADLEIRPLRGNVPTRIKRLVVGDYDAIVLARAGIERLQEAGPLLDELLGQVRLARLDPARFVPAPAQGALALQCRRSHDKARSLVSALDDAPSRLAVDLERQVLARAEGGCDAAFGAWSVTRGAEFDLVAMAEIDSKVHRVLVSGTNPGELADAAWSQLSSAKAVPT